MPKHDNNWHRIHHFFFPNYISVNDGIPKLYSIIKYITINMIFKSVVEANMNCFIIKRDIKDAFCNVLVALKH